MALLEISNLCVSLAGVQGRMDILRGISLSLEKGKSLGVAGESGAGKSMLALAMMYLLPHGAQASGTVRLAGQDLARLDERSLCQLRGNRMAMVFQEPLSALNPLQCAGAQIAEGLSLHRGLSKADARDRTIALLEQVGLDNGAVIAKRYPHELSGGQRQRVMIAMALACGPDLLIADEPTSALDVTSQQQILDLIAGLAQNQSMALLLISHDLAVLAQRTDQLAVLYAGELIESGPSLEVLTRPAHPYTRALIAARPRPADWASNGHTLARLAAIEGTPPPPGTPIQGCAFAPRCPLVMPACTQGPVALASLTSGHQARCLRAQEGR